MFARGPNYNKDRHLPGCLIHKLQPLHLLPHQYAFLYTTFIKVISNPAGSMN
jgi:hypothetical protein